MAGDAAARRAALTRFRHWAVLLALAGCAHGESRPVVRIETGMGTIRAALEDRTAPRTVCNFLRYMDGGHFDGARFFRTVRSAQPLYNPVPIDVIQMEAREGPEFDGFGPVAIERTSATGLSHRAGALSMARDGPDTATSSWSIVVEDSLELDFGGRRNRDGQGFAVFGYVVTGMDVVRAIQAAPAEGERLLEPVTIARIAPDSATSIERARRACNPANSGEKQ